MATPVMEPVNHSPPRQRKSEPNRNQAAAVPTRRKSARSEKEDPKTIGPWRIGKTIGKGSSGRVKIAKHRETGGYAAVKIVPKHVLLSSRLSLGEAGAKQDKMLLGIEREIVIMKLIEHPSVLRLYDVWETGSELYLIMEYVEGGELFDYLVSRGRLQEDEALHYFQQLISGVDYCHRFNICHRDLKPENLLLDRDRNIKIADFGMAALEASDKLLETSCGSPHYASPEIVAGLNYHGSSSDIWSCGIILFALLTGRLPFDDENIRTLLGKVKLGKYNMPPDVPTLAKDLIRGMLVVDPTKRFTMDQILHHPWFTRRPPKPQPSYIAPPTPDQMTRAVGTRSELDPDILSNLRTLWFGASEESIIRALISNEKCWEKVFYFLLSKYRQRHLENFNIDDGPGVSHVSPKRRRGTREHVAKTATAAVKSRSKTSLAAQNRNSVGVNQNRSSVTATPSAPAPLESPRRPLASRQVPAAPSISTPQRPPRVAVPTDSDVFAYPKQVTPTSHGARPLPPAPTQASPVAVRKAPPRPPVITLQEATPSPVAQSERRERFSYPYPMDVPASPSPAFIAPASSRTSRSSATRDASPIMSVTPASPASSTTTSVVPPSTPVIQIPQTVDADMQRFFRDIVDQLHNMSSMRTPTLAGTPNTSAVQTPLTTPTFQDIALASPQFEDAEEYSEEESEEANGKRSTSGDFVFVADSAQIPTAPPLKPRPRSIRVSSGGVKWQTNSYGGTKSTTTNVYNTRHSNAATTSIVSTRSAASGSSATNKENETVEHGVSPRASALQTNYGLGIQTALDEGSEGMDEDSNSRGSRRKAGKKVKLITPATSSAPSPLPTPASTFTSPNGLQSPSSPKVSWFANLFAWKSVNYQLMSVESLQVTRQESRRLLEANGVFVVDESSDSLTWLKCRFDDRINGSLRPVRFRVDFTTSMSSSGVGGTSPIIQTSEGKKMSGCIMSLTLEKGSASTFKSVCNALRKSWEFDIPKTSPVGLGVRLIPSPIPSPETGSAGRL